jgi:peptidoglycan/xylan/chitin deacetylase (PgdA/CDA1 family)
MMQPFSALRALRAKAVRKPIAGRGLILLYHRVATTEIDPWGICVSPDHFAEHVQILNELGICCRVRDLIPALDDARPPMFAITFDDGYADNASTARTILARHQASATFFVVSDAVGSHAEFWWDALERVFLCPGELPSRLRLAVGGRVREWDLGEAARYTLASFYRDARWSAEGGSAPTARHEVFREVWALLADESPAPRQELVCRILEWAGLDCAARPDYAILTRAQLATLAADDRLEVGAHTRTHPSLPVLSFTQQVDEIGGSKSDLERLAGRPVVSFSYPFGRIDEVTEGVVRETGFTTACTSSRAAVCPGVDPLRLPRLPVQNWNGVTFRHIVMNFLRAV